MRKYYKTRIWPVFTREKGTLKEVLVHYKNQAPPSLLVGIRILGEGDEDWSTSHGGTNQASAD
jgi:hypothetical protein